MKDIYQKTTLSQEDGKKSEEQSTQTLVQNLPITGTIDIKDTSGNILTSKKTRNVVVPVKGLEFNIRKG